MPSCVTQSTQSFESPSEMSLPYDNKSSQSLRASLSTTAFGLVPAFQSSQLLIQQAELRNIPSLRDATRATLQASLSVTAFGLVPAFES